MLKQRFVESRSHSPTPTGTYSNVNGTSAQALVVEQNISARSPLFPNGAPFSPVLVNGLRELDTLLQDLNTDQFIARVQGPASQKVSWATSTLEKSTNNPVTDGRTFERMSINAAKLDSQSRIATSATYDVIHESYMGPASLPVQPNALDANANAPRPTVSRSGELDSLIASLNALEPVSQPPVQPTMLKSGLVSTPNVSISVNGSPNSSSSTCSARRSNNWASTNANGGRIVAANDASSSENGSSKRSGSPHVSFADDLVKVIPLSSTPPAPPETQLEAQAKPSTLKKSAASGMIGKSPAADLSFRTYMANNSAPNSALGNIVMPIGPGNASQNANPPIAPRLDSLAVSLNSASTSDSTSTISSYADNGDVYDTLDMYHSGVATSNSVGKKAEVFIESNAQAAQKKTVEANFVEDIPQRIIPIASTTNVVSLSVPINTPVATNSSTVVSCPAMPDAETNGAVTDDTESWSDYANLPQPQSDTAADWLIEPPAQYQETNGRFEPVTVLLHFPAANATATTATTFATTKRIRPVSAVEVETGSEKLSSHPAQAYELHTQPHSADSITAAFNAHVNANGNGNGNARQSSASVSVSVSCAACGNALTGSAINAMGKFWHPEHFRCSVCRDTIGTRRFFERMGEPHCELCYLDRFAPRCAQCDQPILDKCVTALNKCWHYEHFVCAACGCLFDPAAGFLEHCGRAYCSDDYYALFGPKCAACSRPIGAETFVSAFGKRFHRACWTCAQCGCAVDPTSAFGELNGRPLCERHMNSQSPTAATPAAQCAKCSNPIVSRCITALSRKYHTECFLCSFCARPLGNGFRERDTKPYCTSCYSKLPK